MLKGISKDHSIEDKQSDESYLTRGFVMVEPQHYHLLVRKMEGVDDEGWEKKELTIGGEDESETKHKIFLDAVKTEFDKIEANTDHDSSLEYAVTQCSLSV